MGINLGAFIAPLVSGYLGERVGWHYGFAAAGIGMVLGVLWFRLRGPKTLGTMGLQPSVGPAEQAKVLDVHV